MNNRRARGLCEYGGCEVMSGAKRRCEKHAAQHAARVQKSRAPKEACACGSTDGAGRCMYYKSGQHVMAGAEAA